MTWPLYFAESLALGAPEAGLAICLLWTPRERVVPLLDPRSFAIAGNLYSRDGISFVLRNLLAKPGVRRLLLCGRDMTGSGAALAALWQHGISATGEILGHGGRLHRELPLPAVEALRQQIELIDRRDTVRPEAIAALVPTLACPPLPNPPPSQTFPYHEPASASLPAERSGFVVRAPTIRAAYIQVLWHALSYGTRNPTQHSADQREILDLLTVIEGEAVDPADFSYAEWMPFSREQLGQRQPDGQFSGYLAQIVEASGSSDLSYTYGDRLRAFGQKPFDQISAMIDDLRAAPVSRRAVASLWQPGPDNVSPNPPCLNLVQARRRGDQLHLSAYFRSHDLYRAWAGNAYGLRALQIFIAEQIGATPGDLAIHSHSAHVYAHDWEAAGELLAAHYHPPDGRLQRDPRGSFVIQIEPPELVVRHYDAEGEHLQTIRGQTWRDLVNQVTPLISLMSHALYLGSELQKAELAMRFGQPERYHQDRPLNLEPT